MTRLLSCRRLAALALAATAAGCQGHVEQDRGQPAAKVVGQQVVLAAGSDQQTSLTVEPVGVRRNDAIRLTGRLVWNEEATVRVYSPVGGRVTDQPAGVGQRVAAGAVLATIASPDYEQAQADVRKAAADLLLAQRAYSRAKELVDRGAAPAKDAEAAEDAYTTAVSERDRAVAHLAVYGGSAEPGHQEFGLRAPIGGIVVEKNVTRGQEVRPDQMLGNVPQAFLPLFVISDPTRLWVALDASETDVPHLKTGQGIVVRTRAYPDQPFQGTIDLIGDTVDPATRTVRVRGSIANPDRLLKAEMYVDVDVASGDQATPEISAKSVFRKEDKAFVFVETAPGRYERRPVKLGSELNGRITVREGLLVGQRVVAEGCLLLQALIESGGKS